MASSVEFAGLALAVLPLFIETAKAYTDGVESILNVAIRSRWDEKLEEFYEEFYYQIVELNNNIGKIRTPIATSALSNENLPNSSGFLAAWQNDSNIEKQIRSYFRTEDNFNQFTRINKRLVMLLSGLIQEKGNRLSRKDEVSRYLIRILLNLANYSSGQNERLIFNKLQEFTIAKESEATRSTFLERFQFFRKHKERQEFLMRLDTWNTRLGTLIGKAYESSVSTTQGVHNLSTTQDKITETTLPSSSLRNLLTNLYSTFERHYHCSCTEKHDFKLHLEHFQDKGSTDMTVDITFVLSADPDHCSNKSCKWQEASVVACSSR